MAVLRNLWAITTRLLAAEGAARVILREDKVFPISA